MAALREDCKGVVMTKGVCIDCGLSVENADIDGSSFPIKHRGCGGDIAVHTDIGEKVKELLSPSPQSSQPELGPSPGFFAKAFGIGSGGVTFKVQFKIPDSEEKSCACQACGAVLTMRPFRCEDDKIVSWQGVCLCQRGEDIINVYSVPVAPVEFITFEFGLGGDEGKKC